MKKGYYILAAVAGIFAIGLAASSGERLTANGIHRFLSSIFFVDSITETDLKSRYALAEHGPEKVRILIVPGHDNGSWGAEFKGVREADLTLEVAQEIHSFLSSDERFEVTTTRTKGGYTPEFASYFAREGARIEKFQNERVKTMEDVVDAGSVEVRKVVEHNFASTEMGLRLYGINMWANEHKMDIVLHIHFNDYDGRRRGRTGKYSGFSIYMPESQYSNAKASNALAKSVFEQMHIYFPKSDLPVESAGVIEDQELIAIGSNNSVDGAAILIEYGYIYEPQFTNPKLRPHMMKELAAQTYLGIKKFFEPKFLAEHETAILPHFWSFNIDPTTIGKDVLALQVALIQEGFYPPAGFTKNDCPLNGSFGKCTERAVEIFQKQHGITPSTGVVGAKTRVKLNKLYSR